MGNQESCCPDQYINSQKVGLDKLSSNQPQLKCPQTVAIDQQNPLEPSRKVDKNIFTGTLIRKQSSLESSNPQSTSTNNKAPINRWKTPQYLKQMENQQSQIRSLIETTPNKQNKETNKIKEPDKEGFFLLGNLKLKKQLYSIPQKQEEEEIKIIHTPIVSKLIFYLEPYEKEFSSIQSSQIKKIRINDGQDIYKGQINDAKVPHGYGMLIKKNGATLIGKFQNGVIEGESMFFFKSGSYYKGNMVNNMANDTKGQFHSKQMTYIGGFLNSCFHGEGQELGNDFHFRGIYESNRRKKGNLSWGVKQQPKASTKEKQKTHNSSIRNFQTTTRLIDPQLPPKRDFTQQLSYNFVYQGSFDVNQLFNGKGQLKQPQGLYLGEFFKGMKHGKGEYRFTSKIRYLGQYQNDKRSGHGILYNCDNTIAYQGEWKDGLPNGKGYSYDIAGKKTLGQFIDGLNKNIAPEAEFEQKTRR